VLEDRLDQAAIDLPTIMHQRDRRVRDPPNHDLDTADDLAEMISSNESVTVPHVALEPDLRSRRAQPLH